MFVCNAQNHSAAKDPSWISYGMLQSLRPPWRCSFRLTVLALTSTVLLAGASVLLLVRVIHTPDSLHTMHASLHTGFRMFVQKTNMHTHTHTQTNASWCMHACMHASLYLVYTLVYLPAWRTMSNNDAAQRTRAHSAYEKVPFFMHSAWTHTMHVRVLSEREREIE